MCVCVCATVCERASMSGAESWKFIATPSSWLGSLNVFCSVHCVMEFFCVSWDCFHALQTRRTHTLVSDNNNHPTSTYPLSSAYHLFCLRFGEQTNHSFCGAIKTSNDFDLFSVIDSRQTHVNGMCTKCCFFRLSILQHTILEPDDAEITKDLPREILLRIFSFLDVISLCRCAQVSESLSLCISLVFH